MESKKRHKKAKNKQTKAAASNVASGNGKTIVPDVTIGDANTAVSDAVLHNGKPTISDIALMDGKMTISEAIHESVVEKDQQTQQRGDLDFQSSVIPHPHSVLNEQVDLIEILKTLQNEIDSCIEREATLDDRIENLCKENKSYLQDKANHAVKLEELQCEINSRIVEEISLKERIKILEYDKDLQIGNETSKSEVIDKLSCANIILQSQVMQLEESRDTFIQENEQLKKSVSSLETRVLQLEASILRLSTMKMLKHLSVEENLLNEIPTAQLAEETILENAKALKEGNDPYNEPQHRDVTLEHTLASQIQRASSEPNGNANSASHLPESFSDHDLVSQINTEAEPHGSLTVSYKLHEVDSVQTANSGMPFTSIPVDTTIVGEASAVQEVQESTGLQLPSDEIQFKQSKSTVESIEGNENQEILLLPLDEIQIEEINPAVEPEEEPTLPLIDAPLIGAPFRLFSFVAKYVSGADLVK